MTDDFLLTSDGATNDITRKLVSWADYLDGILRALELLQDDVAVVAMTPKELTAFTAAVSTAHGAGRDIRLLATRVQERIDGATGDHVEDESGYR